MKSRWSLKKEAKKEKEFVSENFLNHDLTDVVLKVCPDYESLKLNCFTTEGTSSIHIGKDSIKLFNHLFYDEDDFETKAFAIADKFCKDFCVKK